MNTLHRILFTGLAVLALSGMAPGEESAGEILPRQMQAVDRGLLWLAKNQAPDGSWGASGPLGEYRMAMTGLAGLAFLSAGHVPERGPFGVRLERAIRFILKNQQGDGLITTPNDGQSMYGHGFAMTFLAEVYGMDLSSELSGKIRDCLTKAVKLTDRAQSSWGGWYYTPNSASDEGSVTITQVQALRACANVGIPVPPKTMRSALQYIQKSQNSDGGVRYTARSPGGSSVALSAAGAELMMMGGQYEGKETKKIIEYLKNNMNPDATQGYHDMYTNFYGTQAMIQIGGTWWEKYFRSLRRRLINGQSADGSWAGDVGTTYSTAIAVMVLSMPYTYLPIFQR